jgi:hypothetical protein
MFGPDSSVAQKMVSSLVDALENWNSPKISTFFNEWNRLFGIVYGEQIDSLKKEGQIKLATTYNVDPDTNFEFLLFSIHTYFALLMKFIAIEILTLKETSFHSSFSSQFVHADHENLILKLKDIEDGGIFAKKGITNFLEGDFFQWYLEEVPPDLEDAIREMARAISEFEPATNIINPEPSRDLLKRLYQFLVPQEVRQKLGEYYTPDWLAEFILNEVGYDGDLDQKVLDPACGSGTFIVLAIQRALENAERNGIKKIDAVKKIINNIWGFDLNPLAVIASRTNYIFLIGDCLERIGQVEIPIYLSDSVLWPQRSSGQMEISDQIGGEYVTIKTSVKDFHVPFIWIKNDGLLLKKATPELESYVTQNYSSDEAFQNLKLHHSACSQHERIIKKFYEEILSLETDGRNGIWLRFLKNAFAPMIAGKFDFVVGNPPWIRWGYLSEDYRNATLKLWKDYGLFSLKGHAARLGGGEKDFSMLFTYACTDYYLAETGVLGFLITQEVFKSKGAGEGFRRFQFGKGKYFKVIKAHDFASVQPFEKAANKTAAIILTKNGKTTYPVPYTVWNRKRGIGKIPTHSTLQESLLSLDRTELLAKPIDKETGAWRTIQSSEINPDSFYGGNSYLAHLGARVEPYGVYWLTITNVLPNRDLLIQNMPEMGKRKISVIQERIENNLVYPSIRGSDISRWGVTVEIYTIICQDPKTRAGYLESQMKKTWPKTYNYLGKFKRILLDRAAYRKYHSEQNAPFYSQYNIADYTFSKFKVVWKRMANDIVSAVVSQYKTPFGFKLIIPTDTVSFFPTDSEDEAHYLCAIINSNVIRSYIKSYSSSGRGFGTPYVMKYIGIPQYDDNNEDHNNLSEISKDLHSLKIDDNADEIGKREGDLDKLVEQIFILPPTQSLFPIGSPSD